MPSWFHSDDIILAELRRTGGGPRPALGIPGYDDLSELKRGGQGVVYLATQRSTKRQVAVKVLLEAVSSDAGRRRFEREVDLIASLNHPNIVQIFDSGTTPDGRPYYVMEYIDGAPLDDLIRLSGRLPSEAQPGPDANRERPFAPPRDESFSVPVSVRQPSAMLPVDGALHLYATICDAVHYAHQRGVIHRDLKPSNIRVDRGGAPHVLDFGLAKLTADSSAPGGVGDAGPARSPTGQQAMSITGQFMGSLPWASPEQAEGHVTRLDIRTDIYSLGVILFQLLTGRFPYDVTGPLRLVFDQIVHAIPDRPSKFRRELNDEIDTIVVKCLAKEPDRRYQSAGDLARDVRRFLAGEPIEAKRDSAWYTLRKAATRYKSAARVTAAFLALSILALIISLNYWKEARQQRDAARAAEDMAKAALATAKDEAERASEINKFLTATLVNADPFKTGRTLSVADFLKRASDDAGRRFEKRPRTEAQVRDTLAMSYWSLGMLEDAHREYDRAAAAMEPLRDKDTAEAYHLDGNRALLLSDLGRLDESERLQRALIERSRELFGQDSRENLTMRGNWATTLNSLNRHDEAETTLRGVLEACRRVYGEDDPNVSTYENNLATSLIAQARYDEADALVSDAIRARAASLGPTHPTTLIARGNLAQVRHGQGRLEESERLHREILTDVETALGATHPQMAEAASNFAVLLHEIGKLAEAEQLDRRAIDNYTAAVGPTHPDTLRVRNNLSGVLVSMKRFSEAASVLRDVAQGMEAVYGAEHNSTLRAQSNLALALDEDGQTDEAVRVSERALQTRRRLLGDTDGDTLISINNHGWLLLKTGRKPEALDYWTQAYAGAQRVFADNPATLAVFQNSFGYGLAQVGRFDEGEQQLLAAFASMNAAVGADSPRTLRVAQRLAEMYELWGKPEKAAEYRKLQGAAPETQPSK
ncbi:Serine/threonine-protein kinase PknB [Phycisphaerae bacterium RAS1]|nr:Serine/threonine-protein kinase PknB [Phycisphaerae bacterium RAS1]